MTEPRKTLQISLSEGKLGNIPFDILFIGRTIIPLRLRPLSSLGRMPKNLDGSSMGKVPIPTSSPRLLSILAAFLNKIHAQPH